MRPPHLLLGLLAACTAAQPPAATGTQTTETLRSELVDDDYILRIRLPPGVAADDTASLPLVVQLDPTFVGLEQYAWTTGLVSERESAGHEPAVVVGLDYEDPYGGRFRDYTQDEALPDFSGEGPDRFHRVLAEEILPHLDATLPVDPARRVLVGHSNGAVFGWYEAFRHDDAAPPLFSGIVAADGGIPQALFTWERWHAERATDLPIRLYASRALYNGATQAVTFTGLTDRLEGRGFPNLDLTTEVFPTDHGGVLAPSFEAGLDVTLGGVE